jgi:predicted nucleic acid-binding protein
MRLPRERVVRYLDIILEMPFEFDEPAVIARAIEFYRTVHDDWDDCLVAAYALEYNDGVVFSFDHGFDHIPGVTRIEP